MSERTKSASQTVSKPVSVSASKSSSKSASKSSSKSISKGNSTAVSKSPQSAASTRAPKIGGASSTSVKSSGSKTSTAQLSGSAASSASTVTKRARNGAMSLPGFLGAAGTTAGRLSKSAAAQSVAVEIEAVEIEAVSIVETTLPQRSIQKTSASNAAATRAAKEPSKPLPLSERPIDQIWREYRANPTEELRNFLIARHLDLVAYAAERLHKRLPSEVEINDLKSAGAFGLMDAVESFDPDRGVKFETFCTQRIRGAMFDELRSMDWVPRLVRSRTAKVDKVRKSIEMETGARPTEEEVAARLNVSGDEFEKLQKDSRPISMVSLTRKCFETDSSKDVREIDVVEDNRQENPQQAVQKQDLQALITKGLSRAERLIVILYYYEEMTMKEIGATLDLSESRVSQMHSSILARLKAQMQHREQSEE